MKGKEIRLQRLIQNGKMLCVPMDHGVTTENIGDLVFFEETVNNIVLGGASAIVIHKGMLRLLNNIPPTIGVIIHLSASTKMDCEVKKVLVCDVEEALSLGADAVSIHINFSNSYEKEMLQDFSKIAGECQKLGVPLLAMVYIRNNNNEDISTPQSLRHSIRIATEIGADIIKISFNPSWNIDLLQELVKTSPVPIIVAGGSLYNSQNEFFCYADKVMKTGVLGVSFGRNVFMSKDQKETMKTLSSIVYKNNTTY